MFAVSDAPAGGPRSGGRRHARPFLDGPLLARRQDLAGPRDDPSGRSRDGRSERPRPRDVSPGRGASDAGYRTRELRRHRRPARRPHRLARPPRRGDHGRRGDHTGGYARTSRRTSARPDDGVGRHLPTHPPWRPTRPTSTNSPCSEPKEPHANQETNQSGPEHGHAAPHHPARRGGGDRQEHVRLRVRRRHRRHRLRTHVPR